MMSHPTLSSSPELAKILHGVRSIHQRHHMPLLVDENIHYRLSNLFNALVMLSFMSQFSSIEH